MNDPNSISSEPIGPSESAENTTISTSSDPVDIEHADEIAMRKRVDSNSMDVIHAAANRWNRARDERQKKVDHRMRRINLKTKMAIARRSKRHKKEKHSRRMNRR